MSSKAQIYRILIASPSDMPEERDVATQAVHDWNDQHAIAESVVLLPVKWETHAMPQAGIRPQEAINRQLVKGSDMLVGMFWTKIGQTQGFQNPAPQKRLISLWRQVSRRCCISQVALSTQI